MNILNNKKAEYNSIPLEFCENCLSIKITTQFSFGYCNDCGCTHTDEANVEEWEKLYEARYGHKFINKK